MSLDLKVGRDGEYMNITHNLGRMAAALGVYAILWRPNKDVRATHIVMYLDRAITWLEKDIERFRKYEPSNRWGTAEDLLDFMKRVRAECIRRPNAKLYAFP